VVVFDKIHCAYLRALVSDNDKDGDKHHPPLWIVDHATQESIE